MPEETVFQAGVARVCITPELPCEMAGYFHSRIAERVERDLFAAVMALECDGQTVVLLSCDLIAMTDELCMPAFEAAVEAFGIPTANFIACASHTHTGPEVRRGSQIPCREEALKPMAEKIKGAVFEALENRFEAVVLTGQGRAPGLAFNRLSRCADGSEIFGTQSGGHAVIGPAGPVDDSVQTIGIYDLDQILRGIAVNFACHPDISGGGQARAIDADWPGRMCEYLMQVHGEDVVCLFLQGTAGDINSSNYRTPQKRWLADRRGSLARGVTGAALCANETATALVDGTLAARRTDLEIPFYVRDETLFQLADDLRRKGEAATYFEKNLVRRIETWDKDGRIDRISVSCMRIGDSAIVAMPGEIFTAWGLEIKRYSPARQTLVVELASSHDGLTGYKATVDQCIRGARAKGAYGALPTLSQKHCPAAGQIMTDAAILMLHQLFRQ